MAGLVRCSVAVEVKGRPLHPDKAAKEHGLRLDAAGQTYGGLPMVRVVGFKREMRFTAKDVRQVVASRLAEGRLAFVGLDGLQVVVTKAQPSELEEVMRYLQGTACLSACLHRMTGHLDLRGASLQAPERALVQWQPLAGCPHLVALCLAGNTLLSSSALLTCLGSLPLGARLRVLDLSGTRAEAQLMMWLPRGQPALTHVRLAGCTGLGNESLAALFAGLHELEVLDVAGCPALEEPFAAVADAAAAFASAAPVAGGPYASAPAAAAASRLRLLGVGQTEFAVRLETTRGALKAVAPRAHAVPGSLDIFGGYVALPPTLL